MCKTWIGRRFTLDYLEVEPEEGIFKIFFWQYWGLNLGSHTCWADTLPLESKRRDFCSRDFWGEVFQEERETKENRIGKGRKLSEVEG
jgi:hypothetical protein